MLDELAKAEDNGWSFLLHEISAKKDGHAFLGTPEDVLARIERFDEHGDFVRAHLHAARQGEQGERIDKLLKRWNGEEAEYLRHLSAYQDQRAKQEALWAEIRSLPEDVTSIAESRRLQSDAARHHHSAMRSLEVGLWRCVSGEIVCDEGTCDDECGCCENAELWESPLNVGGWQPKCVYCWRPAQLVEIVGRS